MENQVIDKTKSGSLLQFAPLQSSIDEGFWHRLSYLKLNHWKTDESAVSISGYIAPRSHSRVSNHLSLLSESLPLESSEDLLSTNTSHSNRNRCAVPGTLYNTNTVEGFRQLDKQQLLKKEAEKIWDDICNGKVEKECTLLSRFLLIAFADLKTWRFSYSVAFPALALDPPATLANLKPASEWFSSEEAESVSAACNEWHNSTITTGYIAPCSHSRVSNNLNLLSESLPSESSEDSLSTNTIDSNRTRCAVPGILYNTNTVEGFHQLEKQQLLKKEAEKIWDDI